MASHHTGNEMNRPFVTKSAMSGRARGVSWVFAVVLAWMGSSVRAAEPELNDEQIEQIQRHAMRARDLRNAGDLQGAIAHLRTAIEIRAEPWLIYSLARVHEDAGELALALSHYRLCTGAYADEETRAKALEGIARVEATLTRKGGFVVESTPVRVEVEIDGAFAQPDAQGRYEASVGPHVIALRADGFEPQTRNVDIVADRLTTLRVTLVPIALPVEARSGGFGVGPWVTLGLGTAMVGGGLAAYFFGDGKHAELEEVQRDAEDGVAAMTRKDAKALIDDGDMLKTVGVVVGAVGLAAVVTAIVWGVTSSDEPSAAVRVVSGPRGAELGFGVSGRF